MDEQVKVRVDEKKSKPDEGLIVLDITIPVRLPSLWENFEDGARRILRSKDK